MLGSRVLTESGTDLGEVVEVVVSSGGDAEVVGFEVEPSEAAGHDGGSTVFIPLPNTIAVSGENVIVPDSARDFIHDDLSGFGGAVADFRAQLEEGT